MVPLSAARIWVRVLALGLLVITSLIAPFSTTTQAIGTPSVLDAVAVTTTQVDLSWSAVADAGIAGYAIRRDTTALATVDAATLSYSDTSVQPSTRYSYTVEAIDAQGIHSTPSRPARVKTPKPPDRPDRTPPTPPEMLSVTATSNGALLIDWQDSIDDSDVSAYRIRRDGKRLAVVNSGTLQYLDTQVEPGRTYTYLVEAIDILGQTSAPAHPARAGAHRATARAATGAGLRAPATTQSISAAAVLATYSAALRRYPYLTDLVNSANGSIGYATINWATDRSDTTGAARWGQVAGDGSCSPTNTVTATRTDLIVNSVNEYQWKAQLSLAPNTQYCYRVVLGATDLLGSDPSPRFWTQVPTGSSQPFSFAVIGDWGNVDGVGANPDQANLMQQLAASGVRFALTTGDQAYPSGSQNNYGDLIETGSSISAVFGPQFWKVPGAAIPLFPSMGNHGFSRSDTNHPHMLNWPQDRAVALSNGKYIRETYCCLHGTSSGSYPSTWYAFDAGNARFYVLHAAWADGNIGSASGPYQVDYSYHWAPGTPQYQWLQNDLATHPSQLKFVFFHYPFYSDQKHENSNTYLQGANGLEGLLRQYGVNIAFNGHAHIYQRNNPSSTGLITYVTGGGGAKLQSIGEDPCMAIDAYGIGWSNSSSRGNACGAAAPPASMDRVYHFLKVSVNGGSVTTSGIDELGRAFDVRTYNFGGASSTPTPTFTPTNPPTPTFTPTDTPTPTFTPTNPPTPTDTPTFTPTDTLISTPTFTPIGPPTDTPTFTPIVSPTDTPAPTPTPIGPTTLTFPAAADAYVAQSTLTTNFGSNPLLLSDTSPSLRSYLRFNVSGVGGSVQSAKLRVFVTDGTTNGPQVFASGSSWVENTINWNTQPGPTGTASDDLASISTSAGWIEFNVTPLVSGNGTVSFVLIPQSSNGLDLSAREGANPPQLVVTYGSGINTPTSTPAATPTNTPTPASSLTFTTNADAYVEQGNPTANFGSTTVLPTDNSPVQRSYLRFDVSGVSGSVQSAKLRVFVTDGTTNGPQVFASSSSWVENTINWNTQPGPTGTASDDLASISTSAGWVEFNVTPLVSGNGTVSFVLIPQSSDALRVSAREGTNPPQLVVSYAP
jgi:Calcineurin-like phosphoesterase